MAITKINDINTLLKLSIQIHSNGLSFCIKNIVTDSIVYLHSKTGTLNNSPEELLVQLNHEITSNSIFHQNAFDSVLLVYSHDLYTLVPNSLFDDNKLSDYLKFNIPILKTDYISFDTITENDSVSIFIPYVNINNYIFETFGDFNFKHSSSILIPKLLKQEKQNNSPKVVVNLEALQAEVIVLKGDSLLLFNTFKHGTSLDLLYYILFIYEQLELNTLLTPICFIGVLEQNKAIIELASKYIKTIEIHDSTNTEFNDFVLLNSF